MKSTPSPHPPPQQGRCEKNGIFPLTLPSPARGEGQHIEIKNRFPPPRTGEGEGGGDLWDYFTASGEEGERNKLGEVRRWTLHHGNGRS